tara:strand:+ start:1213 stop:1452 length:240 start_codon:yes stop_codon:yes gene_type:complete
MKKIYPKKIGEKMTNEQKIKIKKYLKIIDEIEKTRSKNNVNWMDILRLSIKNSPDETMKIMKKIDSKDNKISKLFKTLS